LEKVARSRRDAVILGEAMSTSEKQSGRSKISLPTSVRDSKACIFLSWAGEIYGPATDEEVANGVRTSWFEQGALYWYEGLDEWKPVYEFVLPGNEPPADNLGTRKVDAAPTAPDLPGGSKDRIPRSRARRPRASRPDSRRLGGSGRTIVFGAALLAVLVTVGILLLLMLV